MTIPEQVRQELNRINQTVFGNKKILTDVRYAEDNNLILSAGNDGDKVVDGGKIDGKEIENAKRYLLAGQTDKKENGIYFGTNAGTIKRAEDCTRQDQIQKSMVQVRSGSFKDVFFDIDCQDGFVLDAGEIEVKSNKGFRFFDIPKPILSFKKKSGDPLPFNSPMPSNEYWSIIPLQYQLPAEFDKTFLNYEPFVELRLLQSNNKKYKQNRGKKVKKMNSPNNPNGFVLGFSTKYHRSSASDLGYSQVTQVRLETGFVIFDESTNSFATPNFFADWNAETNTPDIFNGSYPIGSYFNCIIAGEQNGTNYSVGDKAYWDGEKINRISNLNSDKANAPIRRFDFSPHQFFGFIGNAANPFKFPVTVNDWENDASQYRNRRSIGSNTGYMGQRRFEQDGTIIPQRSDSLVIGVRFGCRQPNTDRDVIFGEDSNCLVISPKKCKIASNPNANYYYDWNVVCK